MSKNAGTPVKCRRCGGLLRSAANRQAGVSPQCRKRERIEAIERAIAPYSPKQQDKALALLASGGVRKAARPGAWLVRSSDGTRDYEVRHGFCPCEARVPCAHMAARSAAVAVLALAA